ncbi:hypothetical protein [Mucilaginibacter sp. SJ]|uniref:hypothetical protein n=1 Tax=Mucilaginibacter sp. SJ TaxID=3029053 RepID=UPI0023A948A2|nr:hypothetical protein [Mucilaginibacter sp. SJ]WEA01815.1 hypothetical protein MusilaSJ_02615 [Mucilaginibacter sp. SJ]
MSEIDLDQYLGSNDPHFNVNAQGWYFEFTGHKKPHCQISFETFVAAVHEAYHFVLQNRDKPFACLNLLKSFPEKYRLLEDDHVVIIDRLLGALSHHPEFADLRIPFMQIVDYRHILKPYDQDEDIINHRWEFDFDILKQEVNKLTSTNEKMAYIVNTLTDFRQKMPAMDEITTAYYLDTQFIEKCVSEGKRIQMLDQLRSGQAYAASIINEGKTLEDKKLVMEEILRYMSGFNHAGRKIMKEDDYQLLLSYTVAYLETENVPVITKRLPQLEIPIEYIRYSYYLIHKSLYGTRKIKMSMIDFLHAVFSQFDNTEKTTTKIKFSTEPKTYKADTGHQ